MAEIVACVDFGSTYTKAALVDVASGELLATAAHPTTLDTDVLDGWDACREDLTHVDARAAEAAVLACSSAGGGLRIAVVGNEELVTAEAGRRVALSSGGRVVHIGSSGLTPASFADLESSRPDVLLLVGGTDGGDGEVLEHNAGVLSRSKWAGPVVMAGNVESRGLVESLLLGSRTPCVVADNVVPRIGVLEPASARAAIREVFLRHVIGGKHLSERDDTVTGRSFAELVRGATPDVVLTAVELLARGLDGEHPGAGDVVVVDVGGATTDVHSVVEVDAEEAGLEREVVATLPMSRTVEGDLGMRWSAVSTVGEGLDARVVSGAERLRAAAALRRREPGFLPATAEEAHDEEQIATAAVVVALRRHAGRVQVVYDERGRVVERSGKDLREVDLVVGSGGVLRNNPPETAARVLGAVTGDAGGWQLPTEPRVVVDHYYVLAAAGLLAAEHPRAAHALLARLLGVTA